MTSVRTPPRGQDARERALPSRASQVWRGFRRGLADMGSLGFEPARVRRLPRTDAEALAGDWRLVLSDLGTTLQRTERDGAA